MTEPTTATPRQIVERFLRASADNAWDDLSDLYAPDAVIEIPFAPAGIPRRFQGREDHRARFKAAAPLRRIDKVDAVMVHETSDPEVVLVEFDSHATVTSTGRSFVSSYAMVMRIRDGLIVSSRDYANPLDGAELRKELSAVLSERAPGAQEIAERIRRSLEETGEAGTGALDGLFTEDAVYELPFAPPGRPRRIEGREEIVAHLTAGAERALGLGIKKVHSVIHECADPQVAILELQVEGESPATGDSFRFDSSIGVIRIRNGRIASWRDYPNIIGGAAVFGTLPELAATLSR
ncbi:nuclear transport factor 2 family protein [Actinomadura sp. HBU206391]|uniref:nuclear transport factor 2 family protein n=1 Tax=Actinomadura sp. HBU206391 TaxID=2731692 RepID=UPI00165011D8|nr:nuclear transport factor 2 family protein [Actinomadura sp. HBU206391]MBC6461840.1 nuclear transport factor 2 family protein [Actinomadura sp. HBU206391]